VTMKPADSQQNRSGDEPIVIGLFPYASDARRALHALHENHFVSDQVVAAFREPAQPKIESEETLAPTGNSGKWFGKLRQLHRGDEPAPAVRRDETAEFASTSASNGIEAMLAQIELSPEDAHILDRDLDRGAAIVAVRAGERNGEAQTLLEQRARILHGRDRVLPAAVEHQPTMIVSSTPFTSPQDAAPGHIQLFGEVLRVHKEKVSSGDVRVRKESVTHMETVQVPVTREHLVVEHHDESGREDAEHALRIPLSEERVHIDKDTVLREEYKVGKREITENETVSDTVRRERLRIDHAGTSE
jgi:uncharacterized protein (TIGR02271 family)